jgi:hypothetical protein
VIVSNTDVADFLMEGLTGGNSTHSWSLNTRPESSYRAEELLKYFFALFNAEPYCDSHACSLEKVCRKVLSSQAIFSQAVIHRAIEIAGQVGDLELLDLAILSCQGRLPHESLQTIGRHLSSVTLDHFKKLYDTQGLLEAWRIKIDVSQVNDADQILKEAL